MKTKQKQESSKMCRALVRLCMAMICLLAVAAKGMTGTEPVAAYGQEATDWDNVSMAELTEFFETDTGRYGMWDLTYKEFITMYRSIGTSNDLFLQMLREKGARHTDETVWYDSDGVAGIEIEFEDVLAEKIYALHYAPFEYDYADYQSDNYGKSCMEAYADHGGVCEILAKLYRHFVGTVLGESDWQYRIYKNTELNHAVLIVMTEDGRCFQIDNGGVDYWWLGLEVTPDYERIGAYETDPEVEERFREWKRAFEASDECYWYTFSCYIRYENGEWIKRPVWYNFDNSTWEMYLGSEAPKYYKCSFRGMDEIISLAGYTRLDGYADIAELGFTAPDGDASVEDMETFVSHFYEVIMERPADTVGLAQWTDSLRKGTVTGVQVAQGFLQSPEFLNKQLSNEEFVQILYRAYFNREADATGLAEWSGRLDEGYVRSYVMAGLANSQEFRNRCESFGIVPGTLSLTIAECTPGLSDREFAVWQFVERLYREALGRPADPVGLEDWAGKLLSGAQTGAKVAEGFLMSPEFLNKSMTRKAFIQTMYRVFFDRDADAVGLENWVAELKEGHIKKYIFAGFANSGEFQNVCNRYGITGGELTLTVAEQMLCPTGDELKVWEFVERLYTEVLGRPADPVGMTDWGQKLMSGERTGAQAAEGFILSPEFMEKVATMSHEDYVRIMYKAFFGREADETGLVNWVNALKQGTTTQKVFAAFANSEEFGNLCRTYGITQGSVAE